MKVPAKRVLQLRLHYVEDRIWSEIRTLWHHQSKSRLGYIIRRCADPAITTEQALAEYDNLQKLIAARLVDLERRCARVRRIAEAMGL